MSDRPILFSAPMVRALLDGRKTQTRRVLKPQPRVFEIDERGTPCQVGVMQIEGDAINSIWLGTEQAGVLTGQKVRFAIGDRLWVREAHSLHNAHGQRRDDGKRWGPWGGLPTAISDCGTKIAYYREGFDRCDPGRWRPSIHMPRWASRLTLTVTDVRVQRLQDISSADAIAEGIAPYANSSTIDCDTPDPRDDFADLWNNINGPDAWAANPWVVALTFDVHRCNIDAMP